VASEAIIEELRLPGAPESVRQARAFTRRVLLAAEVPARQADAAEVLVSELVTNALVHAAAAMLLVRVTATPTIRIEIEDRNRSLPHLGPDAPTEPGGLGLVIVDRIADRWGADVRADGKVVWFELDPVGDRNHHLV
jgi:anti-sigma regulatory factor (Ser/Thr protein kinase)